MQAPGHKINTREANPNRYITFIRALPGKRDSDEALDRLKAIAAQMKRVFAQRFMLCGTLEEARFNTVFAGRNFNYGQTIELVLRRRDGSFYPMSWITSVMCHEMAHITHMNHGPGFQALMKAIKEDVARMQAAGYFGDGFYSDGHRLQDSARVGGDGLQRSDFPEYVCGVSAGDAKRSGARRGRRGWGPGRPASQRVPLVKGQASRSSGRQTETNRQRFKQGVSRNNKDMGNGGQRLDGRVEVTPQDQKDYETWRDKRVELLMDIGRSKKSAQKYAREQYKRLHPWFFEGRTRGKQANCKSAKEARADALERRLGLRPPSPSDSDDDDDSNEAKLEPLFDDEGKFDILWDPYSSDEDEEEEEIDELDSDSEHKVGSRKGKGKSQAGASAGARVKQEPREPELAAPEAQYEPAKDSLSFEERERELGRMGSAERDAMRVEWDEFFGALVDRDRAAAGLGPRKRAASGRGLSPPAKIAKAGGSGSGSGSSSAAAKAALSRQRSPGSTPTPSPPKATPPKAASKSTTAKPMAKFDISSLTGSAKRQALGLGGSGSGGRTLGGGGSRSGGVSGDTSAARRSAVDPFAPRTAAGSSGASTMKDPNRGGEVTRERRREKEKEKEKEKTGELASAFYDQLRKNPNHNLPPRRESGGSSGGSGDGNAAAGPSHASSSRAPVKHEWTAEWDCRACTYKNHGDRGVCEMCSARPDGTRTVL